MNEQIDAYFQAWNAVVAAADLPTLRAHARERGWDKLRLLSAGNNTFKYDLGSEDRRLLPDDANGQLFRSPVR